MARHNEERGKERREIEIEREEEGKNKGSSRIREVLG